MYGEHFLFLLCLFKNSRISSGTSKARGEKEIWGIQILLVGLFLSFYFFFWACACALSIFVREFLGNISFSRARYVMCLQEGYKIGEKKKSWISNADFSILYDITLCNFVYLFRRGLSTFQCWHNCVHIQFFCQIKLWINRFMFDGQVTYIIL